jgi:hypothetical protein
MYTGSAVPQNLGTHNLARTHASHLPWCYRGFQSPQIRIRRQVSPIVWDSLPQKGEIANAIFEGARNDRGGEREFAAGRGLAESNLHLF